MTVCFKFEETLFYLLISRALYLGVWVGKETGRTRKYFTVLLFRTKCFRLFIVIIFHLHILGLLLYLFTYFIYLFGLCYLVFEMNLIWLKVIPFYSISLVLVAVEKTCFRARICKGVHIFLFYCLSCSGNVIIDIFLLGNILSCGLKIAWSVKLIITTCPRCQFLQTLNQRYGELTDIANFKYVLYF